MSALYGSELLGGMFVPVTLMDVVTDSRTDGVFGTIEHYRPGARFVAMLIKNASPEVQIAEAQGLRELYTIVVPAGVKLKKDDVVMRDADGLTFRLTSNTRDGAAPAMSTIPIAKATCERWDIP